MPTRDAQSIQRLAQHIHSDFGGMLDFVITREHKAMFLRQQFGHARDFFGFVADALQIGDGFYHGHHQAQIARSRLAAGDYLAAAFVDLDFHGVDA